MSTESLGMSCRNKLSAVATLKCEARRLEHGGSDGQQQSDGVNVFLVHERLRSRRSPDFATATQRFPPPIRWLCRLAVAVHGRSSSVPSSSAKRTTLILIVCVSNLSKVFSRNGLRVSTSCRVS